MTDFRFSEGAQEDCNNMTSELAISVTVYSRNDVLNYEGFEGTQSVFSGTTTELVFVQELDTKHEMVASGEFKVGDVRLVFKSDTIAEEEGRVTANGNNYKIMNFTKTKGENGEVIDVKAYGKKSPNR